MGDLSGAERIRRDEAARTENPSLRVTLRADEVGRLMASMRDEAEYADNQADEYERCDGYEMTVAEYRAKAASLRSRSDELDARWSDAVGPRHDDGEQHPKGGRGTCPVCGKDVQLRYNRRFTIPRHVPRERSTDA